MRACRACWRATAQHRFYIAIKSIAPTLARSDSAPPSPPLQTPFQKGVVRLRPHDYRDVCKHALLEMSETVLFTVGLMIVGPLRAVVISEHRYATRILFEPSIRRPSACPALAASLCVCCACVRACVWVVVVQRPW